LTRTNVRERDALPLVTRVQIATVLGVNVTTVSLWEAREGFPVAVPGGPGKPTKYSLPDAVAWYVARKAAKNNGSGGPGGLNLDEERARLAAVQRERVELQNAVRRGELMPVGEVAAVWTEILATVRANLLALPSALAPELARIEEPHAVAARLREAIYAALTALSRWREGQTAAHAASRGPAEHDATRRGSAERGKASQGEEHSGRPAPTGGEDGVA
jgi:phage terminase Nu1 subunit (DNA packaging protein)